MVPSIPAMRANCVPPNVSEGAFSTGAWHPHGLNSLSLFVVLQHVGELGTELTSELGSCLLRCFLGDKSGLPVHLPLSWHAGDGCSDSVDFL